SWAASSATTGWPGSWTATGTGPGSGPRPAWTRRSGSWSWRVNEHGSTVPLSPEREVKLGAAPAFRLPDLSGLGEGVTAGPEREARLETTYYDTRDLRLARWGLSLRHRGGEG